MNPRNAFRRLRDFQSRSFGRSDTSPGERRVSAEWLTLRGRDHVRGDVLDLLLAELVAERGHRPGAVGDPVDDESGIGLRLVEIRPDAPEAPAASIVWQPPQPAEVKTASPAAASPSPAPPSSVVVPAPSRRSPSAGSPSPRRPCCSSSSAAKTQTPAIVTAKSRTVTPMKRPSRLPGKFGVAPREVERGENREEDEEAGGRGEPQLPPVRDSEQHAREPTTGDYARSRGAIVSPCPCSCSQ